MDDNALAAVLSAAPYIAPPPAFPAQDVVLYGGGQLGKMAQRLLAKAGIRVAYVIDKNAAKLSGAFTIPVLTIEQAAKTLPPETPVFDRVYKDALEAAKKALSPYRFHNIYPVYDLLLAVRSLHFTNGWHSGALADADCQGIGEVYHRLSDGDSRAAYLQNLGWRISRTLPQHFINIPEEDKYFNEMTRRSRLQDSCFIDGGAFDLFFTRQALDAHKNPFRPSSILAFEPDPDSFKICREALKTLPAADQAVVRLSDLAMSDRAGLSDMLCGRDMASRLVEEGELCGMETNLLKQRMITLDEACHGLARVGYIKLHVEGTELACLQGGIRTITAHRPVMAVNCTHSRDALWKIAHTIMQHTEDYDYYFRTSANYGEGFYFYAVPRGGG